MSGQMLLARETDILRESIEVEPEIHGQFAKDGQWGGQRKQLPGTVGELAGVGGTSDTDNQTADQSHSPHSYPSRSRYIQINRLQLTLFVSTHSSPRSPRPNQATQSRQLLPRHRSSSTQKASHLQSTYYQSSSLLLHPTPLSPSLYILFMYIYFILYSLFLFYYYILSLILFHFY